MMFLQMQVTEIINTKKLVPRELLQIITGCLCLPVNSFMETFFHGQFSLISLSNSFARPQSLTEIKIHSSALRAANAAPVCLNSILNFFKIFLYTSEAKKNWLNSFPKNSHTFANVHAFWQHFEGNTGFRTYRRICAVFVVAGWNWIHLPPGCHPQAIHSLQNRSGRSGEGRAAPLWPGLWITRVVFT